MDRSPVSILFKSDVTLDSASEDCTYIILLNKDDPLDARGLADPSQVQAGEAVTWDISWGPDNKFDVPYYTVPEAVKDKVDFKGLLATSSIPGDEARVIARITLSKPTNWRNTELVAASWPNPRGCTIRTKLFVIPKERAESLNIYQSSDEALQEAAVEVIELVNGLDTESIDRYASIKNLDRRVGNTNSSINDTG